MAAPLAQDDRPGPSSADCIRDRLTATLDDTSAQVHEDELVVRFDLVAD